MVTKKIKDKYKCIRCGRLFKSRLALKRHSNEHLRALKELKMLQEGYVPEETKLGFGFKGKNRIIVT
ncbi:MAG: hypothetical protein QXD48_02490 [Candidatus Aenigmatarchaeota archaeon]